MDLSKVNSMTKYPSILTYHKIGEDRGRLLDEVQVPFDGATAILTEKIDGVNGRIIIFPDGLYIIGSREELLYAKGDLIGNPQLGIVETLKPIAERLAPRLWVTIFYFEVYGGKTTKNGKQYTGTGLLGARLFDVAMIANSDEILEMPVEKIASWRDNGGQKFYDEFLLQSLGLPVTPRIGEDLIPTGLVDTYDWLKTKISRTQAALDDGGGGRPEGIVVRSADRSRIAKIRFKDYERSN
ncbi:MAG: RNA ligase family protein [Proteobacteria bacterium]|jgi:hypothetical protein|nr:RNA ligase family protein [Pseudomonadota bacterium]